MKPDGEYLVFENELMDKEIVTRIVRGLEIIGQQREMMPEEASLKERLDEWGGDEREWGRQAEELHYIATQDFLALSVEEAKLAAGAIKAFLETEKRTHGPTAHFGSVRAYFALPQIEKFAQRASREV